MLLCPDRCACQQVWGKTGKKWHFLLPCPCIWPSRFGHFRVAFLLQIIQLSKPLTAEDSQGEQRSRFPTRIFFRYFSRGCYHSRWIAGITLRLWFCGVGEARQEIGLKVTFRDELLCYLRREFSAERLRNSSTRPDLGRSGLHFEDSQFKMVGARVKL